MTSFEEIFDRSMTIVEDYRLNNIYKADIQTFMTFMTGLLIQGIPEFNGTLTDLSYTEYSVDLNGKTVKRYGFNNDLNEKEKSILSKLVVYNWFLRHVQTVTQFENNLNTRDFKTFSSSNFLKEKSTYLDKLKEDYLYEISAYQSQNLDKLPFFGDL